MEIKVKYTENKKVEAHFKDFVVKTDQNVKSGGDYSAPSPFDLFLASLATCAGFYIKSFCDSRKIDVEGIEVVQKSIYSDDKKRIEKILIEILLPSHFPEKYKDAVVLGANQCTVKKYIYDPFEFETIAKFK